ncbi:hypothetical protein ANN_06602 [Periplaneta americana]|uniref:Uncharacterized protein n=1 Tax=Periplaneta americana TaxID=6978 RepID=A0ABQ8TE51_PERAM|nr:hypothetical protein ANN_06602 [Periplaneta americana]
MSFEFKHCLQVIFFLRIEGSSLCRALEERGWWWILWRVTYVGQMVACPDPGSFVNGDDDYVLLAGVEWCRQMHHWMGVLCWAVESHLLTLFLQRCWLGTKIKTFHVQQLLCNCNNTSVIRVGCESSVTN